MGELNFKQELVGCYGYPVAENPTQAMIEPAFRAMGLDWRYLTLEVRPEGLKAAVEAARVFGFQGFNCTIPHKVEVIQYLDRLGESAELMGAVNCVVNRDGKLVGENTDGKGFVASLEEIDDPAGKSVVIFGAGGAARAISVEMALAGANRISIVNRSEDRGQELTALLNDKVKDRCPDLESNFVLWNGNFQIPSDTDIVINATSVGLYPDVDAKLALDSNTLTSNMIVADVIPNPPKTQLVKLAESKSCHVIDGLKMLVGQGVIGIEYWTGRMPDASVMRAGLEAVFE